MLRVSLYKSEYKKKKISIYICDNSRKFVCSFSFPITSIIAHWRVPNSVTLPLLCASPSQKSQILFQFFKNWREISNENKRDQFHCERSQFDSFFVRDIKLISRSSWLATFITWFRNKNLWLVAYSRAILKTRVHSTAFANRVTFVWQICLNLRDSRFFFF